MVNFSGNVKLYWEGYIISTDDSRIRPRESEVERLICDNTLAKKLFRLGTKNILN